MMWTIRQRCNITERISGYYTEKHTRSRRSGTVLLIHGVGLRAECWNQVAEILASEFSVCAIDLPGHGSSLPLIPFGDRFDASGQAVQTEADGLDSYTSSISPVLEVLPRPIYIAGHSLGALIALEMASDNSEAVQAVAALNCIYRRTEQAKAAVQRRAEDLVKGDRSNSVTLQRWFGSASEDSKHNSEREACALWLESVDIGSYAHAYSAFARCDGPDSQTLKQIKCPALFMTGSYEPNSTPEMSEALAMAVRDGQASIIASSAHMMPMTHSQEVGTGLIDFFM